MGEYLPNQSPKIQPKENKKIILYVDDDMTTCMAGVRTLQKKFHEFEIISCRDYESSREKIIEFCNEIALICLDYNLNDPKNTGGDLATLIYLFDPQIPIISISNTPKEWGILEQCLRKIMLPNSKFGKPLNTEIAKILGI